MKKFEDFTLTDVRLDKWLWAARFFKTRRLAKEAITGGKVHYNGLRSKVSKITEIGALLSVRQGFYVKTVVVKKLSDNRQSAPIAEKLYEETKESVEEKAKQRKPSCANVSRAVKPNKKERRQIIQFKSISSKY